MLDRVKTLTVRALASPRAEPYVPAMAHFSAMTGLARASFPEPSMGARLLLVEDDVSIRSALAEMLGDEGFTVTTAENGRAALDQLRQGPAPDVIVLDLMMPEMDGWEFRVAQRADPLLAGIPLLAMSADLSAKA